MPYDPQNPFDLQPFNLNTGAQGVTTQPIQGSNDNPYDLRPYNPYTPPAPPEQSWGDWLMGMGIRTVPAVIGGMVGGPFGAVAGGALGEFGAEAYEGKPFNPGMIAFEGGLNAVPFAKLAKYVPFGGPVIKEAVSAGLQGAGLGLTSSVPRHIIETGKWELPSISEAGGGAIGGGLFGGVLGAGHQLLGGTHPELPTADPTATFDPFNPPLRPPPQPRLPGMEDVNFGQRIPDPTYTRPSYEPPTPEPLDLQQRRAFAGIESQAARDIFSLQVQQSEATRAGDHATATSLEDEILKIKMDTAEAKRNWRPSVETPSVETPAPTFDDLPSNQGELSFNLYRGSKNQFMAPPSVESGMRGGILGPEIGSFTGTAPPASSDLLVTPAMDGEGLRDFQRRTGLGWAEAKRQWEISAANRPPPAESPYHMPPAGEEPPLVEPPDLAPTGPNVRTDAYNAYVDQARASGQTPIPYADWRLHQVSGIPLPTATTEVPDTVTPAMRERLLQLGFRKDVIDRMDAQTATNLIKMAPVSSAGKPAPPTKASVQQIIAGKMESPARMGAMQGNEVAAGNEIRVPKVIANRQYITNMEKSGYELSKIDGEEAVFVKVERGISEATRPPDDNYSPEMRQVLMRIFRPNEPLQSGSMGDFELRRIVRDITSETNRANAYQKTLDWHEAMAHARAGGNGEDIKITSNLADLADQKYYELSTNAEGFIPEEDQGIYNEPTDPAKLQDFLSNTVNPPSERLPVAGPRPVSEFDRPRPPSEGQQELPLGPLRTTRERKISEMAGDVPRNEMIGMEIGDRKTVLLNMQGQYAEHGARVANKELLQNAIDAVTNPDGTGMPKGKVNVTIDYDSVNNNKNGNITVEDNGPGIPYDVLKNEYITLTGSGKRGQGKYIGEMGVGKATYLLGADSFEIVTVAREPDGSLWKHTITGTPEDMINGTTKLSSEKVAPGTPTGTKAKVFESDKKNLEAAEQYLKTFSDYSNTPIEVNISHNKYGFPINNKVNPRLVGPGKQVATGTAPGGNYRISVPDNAVWKDNQGHTMGIISNRGMFQGVEQIVPPGYGRMPDRILIEIDPTVPATDGKRYPLTAPTRERMKAPFKEEITKVVGKEIMEASRARIREDIQAAYDALQPQPNPANPSQNLSFVTNNRGGRYAPDEVDRFNSTPEVQAIAGEMKKMLDVLDSLFPTEQIQKTAKFGFDLADDNAGGVNIPNLNKRDESSILINLLGLIKGHNPETAAERVAHTILHEFNHNIIGEEGDGFTWQLLITDSTFGTKRRAAVAATIERILTGPDGEFTPEIQKLLQEHTAARGRSDTTIDFIARQKEGRFVRSEEQGGVPISDSHVGEGSTRGISEVASNEERPGLAERVKSTTGWGQGSSKGVKLDPNAPNIVKEIVNLPTNLTTTGDLSAPGRQGLAMIFTPEFWKAMIPSLSAVSKERANIVDAGIRDLPTFRDKIDVLTGKEIPSPAKEAGLDLMSLGHKLGPREEFSASKWIENGAFLGPEKIGGVPNPIRFLYKYTAGATAAASNRIFTTFLNHLRANRFERLMNLSRNMAIRGEETGRAPMEGVLGGVHFQSGKNIGFTKGVTGEQAAEMNPFFNKLRAKEIADFVNTATGRGPLRTHLLPFRHTELNLEKAAGVLGYALFAPKNTFSRIRMLNPSTYIMASPFVRKQYLKAALSTAAAWWTFTELAKNADPRAEVNHDLTSADFGKVKIGDFRLDPAGGFQQFLVAYARLYQGGASSSATGEFHKFGEGYQAQTAFDMGERLFANKLNPVAKFAWDLANASQYNPFHVKDRTAQMFVPLIVQDFMEIQKEDPNLLMPWMIPVLFGSGSQIYSKGESVSKFVPQESDWNITGGGFKDLMPSSIQNLWDRGGGQ